MSAKVWLAGCLLATIFGGILGWSARVATTDHRYIRALAQRHEAVTDYYLQQTDQMIQDNKGNIAKGRKNDGQKAD